MGLDGVELLMDVEDTFGIKISDDELFDLSTVGKLHDYLCEHVADQKTLSSLSDVPLMA